jgi:hypothetical protein
MYTEGSVVIIQGELLNALTFRVDILGLPPAEDRSITLNAIGKHIYLKSYQASTTYSL